MSHTGDWHNTYSKCVVFTTTGKKNQIQMSAEHGQEQCGGTAAPATCRSALEVRAQESHLTEPPQFSAVNQKLLHQSWDRRPTDLPGSTLVMLENFSSMKGYDTSSLSLLYLFFCTWAATHPDFLYRSRTFFKIQKIQLLVKSFLTPFLLQEVDKHSCHLFPRKFKLLSILQEEIFQLLLLLMVP